MINKYLPLIKEIWWYITRKQIARFSAKQPRYTDPDNWARVRSIVLERDHYTCTECGSTDRPWLDAHHIKPKWRGGADTVENLRTLCGTCHHIAHKTDGTAEHSRTMRSIAAQRPHTTPAARKE